MKVSNSFRYTKSFVDVLGGLYSSAFSVFLNEDKWDSICPSDQELNNSVSDATITRNFAAATDELGVVAKAESSDYDITVTDPDEAFTASLKAATQFTHDGWIEEAEARGVDGEAALNFFLEQVAAATSQNVN